MVNYDDIERVFELVDRARAEESSRTGYLVTPVGSDEKAEAYRWADGNELRNIVDTPGYEILIAKISRYIDEAIKTLFRNTIPTDKEAVFANFAVGYAACEILDRLQNDIKADLEAAESMPEVIKQGIRITRGAPADAASTIKTSV